MPMTDDLSPDMEVSELPLVSVLIPSFNHARYIESCLDSILDDGYGNLQLLLLDDGSSDDSFAIATRWAESNAHRFKGGTSLRRQTNQGVVRTLNSLIGDASGEFFTLLASDDCLLPGGISVRVEYLRSHPEHLAVFADARLMDKEGKPLAESAFDFAGSHRAALRCECTRGVELITHWIMPGPVFLAHREVLSRVGRYDERYAYEDRDYYLRLIAAGVLGFVNVPVATYRRALVKDAQRYALLASDREQIERRLVNRFKGVERIALLGMIQRHRQPRPRWFRWVKSALRVLRKLNRRRALRLLGRAPGGQDSPDRS